MPLPDRQLRRDNNSRGLLAIRAFADGPLFQANNIRLGDLSILLSHVGRANDLLRVVHCDRTHPSRTVFLSAYSPHYAVNPFVIGEGMASHRASYTRAALLQ